MNVTIKISDKLGRQARHLAVDAGVSFSGWVAGLIQKELAKGKPNKGQGLLELLGDDQSKHVEFEFPRDTSTSRNVDFSR